MGLYRLALLQLAPLDLAVPYAGLPPLWHAAPGPPFDECGLASGQHHPPVPLLGLGDPGHVAQRHGGGSVCPAPAARGVRRLGGGKKGRAEHLLLAGHHAGLRRVRPGAVVAALSVGPAVPHPGAAGQTHAGHPALGAAAPGLLAPGPDTGRAAPGVGPGRGRRTPTGAGREGLLAATQGKDSPVRPGWPILSDYHDGAKGQRRRDAPGHPAAGSPDCQRPGLLRRLCREAVLALPHESSFINWPRCPGGWRREPAWPCWG